MLRIVLALLAVLSIAVGLLMTVGVIASTGWTDAALLLVGFNLLVGAWALGNQSYNLSISSNY